MKFFLLKMYVVGIKNIDKEIEINFYKSTISKKFDASNSHVKAIYGANGAGKTGIMYAVDIYQNLVLNPNYLTICNNDGSLNCLINQNLQEFKINMIFLCTFKNNTNKVFSHLIRIKRLADGFKIVEEQLSELSGSNLNNTQRYSTIFHIVDGKLVELRKKCEFVKELHLKTMNLLSSQSFVCAAIRPFLMNQDKDMEMDKELLKSSLLLVRFATSLTVVLQGSDRFVDYNEILEQFVNILNQLSIDNGESNPSNTILNKKLSYL
ncbi:MAG: ATP-binding protein, partial [Bacilli bacterium]|nr:ATP-binding protein [Bacilli bacterium]